MKRIWHYLILFFWLITCAFTAPVTLEWDASVGALSYELHYGSDPENLNNVRVSDTTTITVPEVGPGIWYFEVKAVGAGGLKSKPSNRVTFTVPLDAPNNLRVVEIQTSSNLTDWKTIAFVPHNEPTEFVRARLTQLSPSSTP